jgi:hypothetical protein
MSRYKNFNWMKSQRLVLFVLFVMIAIQVGAQSDSTAPTPPPPAKKSWYLTLGMDQKMSSFSGKYKYYYQGEYNVRNWWSGSSDPEWAWRTRTWEEPELLKWSQFFSTKVDILVSRGYKFKGGLSYNFGGLIYYDTLFLGQNLSFIAITGIGEYDLYLKKGEIQGSPFAFGSVAAGFYRESEWNGGPGRELFGEMRAGLGYHNRKDYLFRAWVAGNYLNYREHSMSKIFQREQTRKIDVTLFYWGLGVYRMFELVPE